MLSNESSTLDMWSRVKNEAFDCGFSVWLGVDADTGEVVAQINDGGGIIQEGRGHTSNEAIQWLADSWYEGVHAA